MLGEHKSRAGFTLVEILIVVILLGILAAIIIPQFSNATTDARRTTLKHQVQQLRDQIQVYVLQHGQANPTINGNDWSALTGPSVFQGNTCGPYLMATPRNPLNGRSDVTVVNAEAQAGDAVAGGATGYVYNPDTGHLWGTNTAGTLVFNEDNLQDPNN